MKNILIIQLSLIADIIQTIPLQANIKKHYTDCNISLLCVDEFKTIVKTFKHVDNCIGLSAELTYKLKSLTQNSPELLNRILQSLNITVEYDLLINCNLEVGVSFLVSEIKAKDKNGRVFNPAIPMFINGDWGKYLFAFTQFRKQNFFNMADIYANMAELATTVKDDLFHLPDLNKNEALIFLEENGFNKNKKLVILQLVSSKNFRSWGINNFANLANQLLQKGNIQILIAGSKSECELADQFMQKVDMPIINLVGKTKLEQLPAILSHGDLMITNDTGPMHIAGLINTPLLVITLSTAYFAETAPYSNGHLIVHADLPCYPCLPGNECKEIKCRNLITPQIVTKITQQILFKNFPDHLDFRQIQIYKTVLSNNNMLSFIPISVNIGEHFIEGFIHRLFWENFLKIPHDDIFIQNTIDKLKASETFKQRFTIFISEIELAVRQLERGNLVLENIEKEFLKDPINQEDINNLLKQFQGIESHFSNNQDSIFKIYHLLDLGSIEQKQFTIMVQQIHQKYKNNYGLMKIAIEQLKGIELKD